MVVKRGERGVVGIVILCATAIGLISYGFADDIIRFIAEHIRSIPFSRIANTIINASIRIKALIASYLP